MPIPKPAGDSDPEIGAISVVYAVLKELEPQAQQRVLQYVAAKLGLQTISAHSQTTARHETDEQAPSLPLHDSDPVANGDSDGINSVAIKWMKRSGLELPQLSKLFSLNVDEIDLVSKAVPGENKKERMHSVILLKAIASYLGSGAARVTDEQVREACLHYDAFDSGNFSKHLT